MKWHLILASIVGLGFWGWVGLTFFGAAVGTTLLIFPFGILPILLIIGWILFSTAGSLIHVNIGSKVRSGITEYPTGISMCLYGGNNNEIAFTDDGKSVIITVKPSWDINIDNIDEVKNVLKTYIGHHGAENLDWFDHYIITKASKNEVDGGYQIVVSISDEVVLSSQYIEHEIQNVGRVFKRNSVNKMRWLLQPQGMRKTMRKDGRLFVYIDRMQLVPGMFDEKQKIMSEKQITRNIKNRLWNRVNVKCISIDANTYCGEMLGV